MFDREFFVKRIQEIEKAVHDVASHHNSLCGRLSEVKESFQLFLKAEAGKEVISEEVVSIVSEE